jgi:hypothetical protein
MSVIISGTEGLTFNDASLQGAAASPYVLKNRIINGDMRIDQRNAGASVTPSVVYEQYTLDRWDYILNQASKVSIQQNAGSVTPPTGFTNYLGVTSLSSYTVLTGDFFVISQKIEGYNVADLDFGKSTAKTFTISFWVRSSLTGTFGGALRNGNASRSYPFTYTISSANTWEQKTITIAGDTVGTWYTTNGIGIEVHFGLGAGSTYSGTSGSWAGANYLSATGATSVVGTSGATFYITGVQLEVGSSATPFERRLYNQELANCQRYAIRFNNGSNYYTPYGFVTNTTSTGGLMVVTFPTTMRTTPSLTTTGPNRIISGSANSSVTSITLGDGGPTAVYCDYVSTGLTIGQSGFIGANGSLTANLLFTAEL